MSEIADRRKRVESVGMEYRAGFLLHRLQASALVDSSQPLTRGHQRMWSDLVRIVREEIESAVEAERARLYYEIVVSCSYHDPESDAYCSLMCFAGRELVPIREASVEE